MAKKTRSKKSAISILKKGKGPSIPRPKIKGTNRRPSNIGKIV